MKIKNLVAIFGLSLVLGVGAAVGAALGSSPVETKAENDWTNQWPAPWSSSGNHTFERQNENTVLSVNYSKVVGESWDCFGFDIAAADARKVSFAVENMSDSDPINLRIDLKNGDTVLNQYSLVNGQYVETTNYSGTTFNIPANNRAGVEIWYSGDIGSVTMFADSASGVEKVEHSGSLAFSDLMFSDGCISGSMTIDCTADNWAYSKHSDAGEIGQHLSIYYWNEHTNQNAWGSYATTAHGEMVAVVDYDLSFKPTGMKAVLYDARISEEDWAADPWRSEPGAWGYWSGTQDLEFKEEANIMIAGGSTEPDNYSSPSSVIGYAYYSGKSEETGWEWKELGHLENVKMNGLKHVEYFSLLTITHYEEFLIGAFETTYGYDRLTISEYLDSSDWISSYNNIKLEADKTVRIAVYFDRNAGTIYFNEPNHAEADEYAQFFLGDDCEATKENWLFSGFVYQNVLSNEIRAIFDAVTVAPDHDVDPATLTYVEQAVQRYEYVILRYGTTAYADFMNRFDGPVTPSTTRFGNVEISNSTMIIVIVEVATIATVGGAVLIAKKKHK